MSGPGFLDLPVRSDKPRRTGITHVPDRGIPLARVNDLLEQGGIACLTYGARTPGPVIGPVMGPVMGTAPVCGT